MTIAQPEKQLQPVDGARREYLRLKAGNPEKVAVTRTVKNILQKYNAKRISDLSEADCKPVSRELQKALVRYLVTIAPVVPLPKNRKGPPPQDWPKLATRDPKVAERWVDCNYGLVTNAIDVDSKDPKPGKRRGTEVWADLVEQFGEPANLKTITPSDGFHVIVADKLPNSQNALGDGIDTRGEGVGYVVAPGSFVVANGKDIRETGYYRAVAGPVVSLPWVVERLSSRRAADTVERGLAAEVELDTAAAIEQAIDMLKSYAASPREVDKNGNQINGPAIEGEGGDSWTVQVAMNVGDLGISKETCLSLMFEYFNDACEPPWSNDDGEVGDRLSTKVDSAYNSRQKPPGSDSAEAEFADDPAEPITPTISAERIAEQLAARKEDRELGIKKPPKYNRKRVVYNATNLTQSLHDAMMAVRADKVHDHIFRRGPELVRLNQAIAKRDLEGEKRTDVKRKRGALMIAPVVRDYMKLRLDQSGKFWVRKSKQKKIETETADKRETANVND
jgi:hypothetical protein